MRLFKKIKLWIRKMRLLRAQEFVLDEALLLRNKGKYEELKNVIEIAEGISNIYKHIE